MTAPDAGAAAEVAAALKDISSRLAELADEVTRLGTAHAGVQASRSNVREPLVLLSGMLGDGTLWDGVMSAVNDVVAVRTSRIDLDDSVAEMAESVLAESPEFFALAGHSLGGIVALEIVRRAPERVTRLALLNVSGRAGSEEQQAYWSGLAARVEAGDFTAVADELVVQTLPASRRGEVDLIDWGRRMAACVGPGGLYRQLVAQQTRPESLPSLSGIRVPTLVVSGELDTTCPPQLQEELVTGIPLAKHVVLDGVGHMAPLEAPAAVARVLLDWLH